MYIVQDKVFSPL